MHGAFNSSPDGQSFAKWPQRLRARLRFPRRLRLTRAGWFVVFATLALGFATLNTGNNLLYLLLGALLGIIMLSGWLSERALRDVHVQRTLPRTLTAGVPVRLQYTVRNGKRRLPGHGLEIRESTSVLGAVSAFVPVLNADSTVRAAIDVVPRFRGVHRLDGISLATSFPFGLFVKERDCALPATAVVWPRTDRSVRPVRAGGARGRARLHAAGMAAAAERGDYRGLREYRHGDDARDIHWRSTARRGEPIVREYDRDSADEYWIVLDGVAPTLAAGEVAVEVAAALVVQAAARGHRFGLAAGSAHLVPGGATSGADAALDLLAGFVIRTDGPPPTLPARPEDCVLVTARGTRRAHWGDVFDVSAEEFGE